MKRKENGFLRGALILTLGMAAVKVMGALFKVPLKFAIGEYGMGLFNTAYSFWAPIFALATAGLPVAVSRLVSEARTQGRWRDVQLIKRTALPLFLGVGAVGMAALMLLAPFYCGQVMGTKEAILPMLALAPAMLFACGSSVYRGWFEGMQNMTPTAVSQVIEAVVKLGLGLSLSRWAVWAGQTEYARRGTVFSILPGTDSDAQLLILSIGAAAAILGVTLGSAASLVFLSLRHRFGGKADPRLLGASPPAGSRKEILKRLLAIMGPVAAGSAAGSCAGLVDATVLQGRLSGLIRACPEEMARQFGMMIPQTYLDDPDVFATFLYGCYTLAMTVYLLVPALTQAIGISALPSVTEAFARGDREELGKRMAAVVRVTALVCLPAGLGMSAAARPIVEVLYGQGGSAPLVAGVLFLLGPAAVFAAMSTPLASMLQAVGRADLPVKLLLAAMTVKLLCNRFLCGLPELNIYGAALGTLTCYLFLSAGQLIALRRVTGIRLPLAKLLLGPAVSALLCALGANACYAALTPLLPGGAPGTALGLGAAVITGGMIYIFGLLFTGAVGCNDLFSVPCLQKIAKTLEKRRWM